LGAKREEGGVADLVGDNKEALFKINIKVNFEKKGNFTGVISNDKTYSVEEWNKKIQREF